MLWQCCSSVSAQCGPRLRQRPSPSLPAAILPRAGLNWAGCPNHPPARSAYPRKVEAAAIRRESSLQWQHFSAPWLVESTAPHRRHGRDARSPSLYSEAGPGSLQEPGEDLRVEVACRDSPEPNQCLPGVRDAESLPAALTGVPRAEGSPRSQLFSAHSCRMLFAARPLWLAPRRSARGPRWCRSAGGVLWLRGAPQPAAAHCAAGSR